MRLLRLGVGVFIIIQGFLMKEWMFAGLGVLFSLMPLFNVGCGSTSGCNVPARRNTGKMDDISYDEIR